MAENDAERTPLLQDQDQDENLDLHRTTPRERAQDLVSNIRDVIENQIPNGHRGTPPASPKRIHALLPRLFGLINSLVDTVNVDDDIVSDDVVEFVAGFGKEVIYCLLRCVETFQQEGQHDVGRKRLMEARLGVAQTIAAAVTKVFVEKDMMATYCHVLTRPYYAVGEESNTAESAIEIAIRVHATDFLADVEVQRCVQALWNGLILQVEDDECRVRFVEYSGVRRSRHFLWEWVDVGRLNVPNYQNNLKIALFVLFLAMYTVVVNDRTKDPTVVEWFVYVFSCGYIFEEFRLIFEGGTAFFLGSLWHWINIISYSMLLVSFAFRFTACFVISDAPTIDRYNDIAYDLLALLSIFLWVKTLSLLDGLQYFGTMVMVLQKMIKDGIMFFWLLAWVYIGFFQSFYALQRDELKDFRNSTMLLVRGFLQDPDWELAESIDNVYGGGLFALYLFLTSIILLNLLIALFNSSYTNITDSAEKEYLALYTFKVFSYLKSPDQFPYAAPFNLIEVFFIIPLNMIVSKKTYARINRVVMGTLFSIPVLIIARSERKRYLKLRNTNEEDDIQNGRRIYRHLTAEETDVDDLFLLATQEFDGDVGATATPNEVAATLAQAEEGTAATDRSREAWMSSKAPVESFVEFKARRAKEREAKAAAILKTVAKNKGVSGAEHEPHGGSEAASRTREATDAPATIVANAEQNHLTDVLVQSLLASLARMETRQKELETMMQSYIEQSKEDRAITAAKAVASGVDLGPVQDEQGNTGNGEEQDASAQIGGDSEYSQQDTFSILVATDNHLGYLEKDPVRKDDSFAAFEEILALAAESEVDMILLGGDLFHENKPSRKTMFITTKLLRKYCLGDKPVSFEFLSEPSDNFPEGIENVNYMDPNLNVAIPVFSIHGNHDDPSGDGNLCALDQLSMTGLVNYFGRSQEIDNVVVKPILLQKGASRLALYGIGNIRDERLHQTFLRRNVKMIRPVEEEGEDPWYNLLVLHQNRVMHNPKSYIPEAFLDDFINLVIWGHEHECLIDPAYNPEQGFHVSQPGSSVATSLSEGESREKHVAILKICKGKFNIEKIRLQSVRPFIMSEVTLADHKLDPANQQKVNSFISRKAHLIRQAKEEWLVKNGRGSRKRRMYSEAESDEEEAVQEDDNKEPEAPKPLVRLRVEYSGGYEIFNPQRFGQEFVDEVANPRDIVQFYRKKTMVPKSRSKDITAEMDEVEAPEKLDTIRVENLVQKYLSAQNLSILPEIELADAVRIYVEKDEKDAVRDFVKSSLNRMQEVMRTKQNIEMGEALLKEASKEKDNQAQTYALEHPNGGLASYTRPARGERMEVDEDEHVEESDDDQDDGRARKSSSTAKPARGRGAGRKQRGAASGSTRGTRGRGSTSAGRGGRASKSRTVVAESEEEEEEEDDNDDENDTPEEAPAPVSRRARAAKSKAMVILSQEVNENEDAEDDWGGVNR
ncbi:Double-strand break repair protein mre11a, partial [Dissophora globulifera]